LTGFRIPGEG